MTKYELMAITGDTIAAIDQVLEKMRLRFEAKVHGRILTGKAGVPDELRFVGPDGR